MSTNELDAKVCELRELRNFEAEIKSAVTAIENDLKAEMLSKSADVLNGRDCTATWKAAITSRFDSSAFKLPQPICFRSLVNPPPAGGR